MYLGKVIHDSVQIRDAAGNREEGLSLAANTTLLKDGAVVDNFNDISAYATIAEDAGGEGWYNITLNTAHANFPGVGIYEVRIDSDGISEMDGIDYASESYEVESTDLVLGSITTGAVAVTNAGGDAVVLTSGGGNGHGLKAVGEGTGNGIAGFGGDNGIGISGDGGAVAGDGIRGNAGAIGHGIAGVGGTTSGDGVYALGPVAGNGIRALATGAEYHGMVLQRGGAEGEDLKLVNNSAGVIAATVSALLAKTGVTAGGTATVADILKRIHAFCRGKVVISGSNFVFYDDDNTTVLFTLPISATGRTTS